MFFFYIFQTVLLISSQNSPTPSEGLRDGFDDLSECRLIILTFCHLIIVSEGGYLISLAKKTMERPFLGKRRDMAPHTHFTENGEICRVTYIHLLHYQIQIPMSGHTSVPQKRLKSISSHCSPKAPPFRLLHLILPFFEIIDFSLYGKNIKLCFVNYTSHFFKF